MILIVRRLAQVVLALWFAAATTSLQACMTPVSGYSYQSTRQPVSPVGASSGAAGQGSLSTSAAGQADSGSAFNAAGYTRDSSESASLTDYLKTHRLPLVGAQVLKNSQGNRAVVLYGFVATPFGKSDAAAKARRFMKDGDMTVANRIEIRPELLGSNAPSSASQGNSSASASAASPGVQDYENQRNQVQQYQQYQQQQQQQYALQQYQQQQGSAISSLLPLLAIAGLLGMSMAGGSSGFGGFGVSPGYPAYPGPGYPPGPVPYNPSYGSPYPSYGSPFSPYP